MTMETFWTVVLAVASVNAASLAVGILGGFLVRRVLLGKIQRDTEKALATMAHEFPITGGIPDDDFEREVERRMREELSRLAKDKSNPVGTTPWEAEGKVKPPDQPEQF